MSVTAAARINPTTIVDGEKIHVFDCSTTVDEEITGYRHWMTDSRAVTASLTPFLFVSDADQKFEVGECVFWTGIPPGGFSTGTPYYVSSVTPTYITLSATLGGAANGYTTPGTTPELMKGSTDPYPILKPFPVIGDILRSVTSTVYTSTGDTGTSQNNFFTINDPSTKPLASGTYKDVSIFIYNSNNATLINRNTGTSMNLIYTKLKFTNYLTRISTATFTIVNQGSATQVEKDLLLAGSSLVPKSDNFVAIIVDKSVVWSGKILRSKLVKSGLFTDPVMESWEIECEGDISRMRNQNIKTANKGDKYLPLGSIISLLVENASTNTTYGPDINWNGTINKGIRSSEGVYLDYNINDSDMYSQLMTLATLIDFDWRTRLDYVRYAYTRDSSIYTVSTTNPYGASAFIGRWAIATSKGTGATGFGKVISNTATTITVGIYPVPTTTGHMIIIMDPVLDIVSDLSTPSKVATFRINSQPSTTYNSGYGFNDKTDKTALTTKVIAKGKTSGGSTVTASVAATTPWIDSKSMFKNSSMITHRSEGIILRIDEGIPPYGASTFWVAGWKWALTGGDYFAMYLPGSFHEAYSGTQLYSPSEVILGNVQATTWQVSYPVPTGLSNYVGGTAFIIKNSELASQYGSIYVKSIADMNYVNGDQIYIGGEYIDTVDYILDPKYGYRIRYVCDGTINHRYENTTSTGAHVPGVIVWKASSYNENPSMTGSPISYHGLILKTFTSDINVTIPELETYATLHLIAHSNYYRKADFWCFYFDWYKTDQKSSNEYKCASFIEVGDSIVSLQNEDDSESHMIYGKYKNLWQVISYSFDASTYRVTVELGDFERNVYVQIANKTAALEQTIN